MLTDISARNIGAHAYVTTIIDAESGITEPKLGIPLPSPWAQNAVHNE